MADTSFKRIARLCWFANDLRTVSFGGVALALILIVLAHSESDAKKIGPGDNLCKEINAPDGPSEIVLGPGAYQGPCRITRAGTAEAPLVIRASDLSNRPEIHYQESKSNVFEIDADHVVIRGLQFAASKRDVDGIRVISGNGISIEDCRFTRMGGIAIVSNHASLRQLTIRRNVIVDSRATAMYFGCHDGSACQITELLISNNFISGVTAPDPEVGYGIQVKLNSTATVRDNVVLNTKGPPIMVYGARDPNALNVIEGNFVAESRTSSGIVVGGGPVYVQNNISVQNREAGIALQDYAGRGLLRKIAVEHNTIYNNAQAGVVVHAEREVDASIRKNAIAAGLGTPVLAVRHNGIKIFGNQDCSTHQCFSNPEQRDFTPRPGSALLMASEGSAQARDYFGSRRPPHPAVGAVERPGGIVRLGIKP